MPGLPMTGRRHRDDDEDGSSSDYSQGSASKRPRLTPDRVSTPHVNGYHDPSTSSMQRESLVPEPTLRKHQPGSIVRVKLTNFVTYTEAEFKPGPSLNMVIGPNGTGKSTLVCAICLGLGWGTQHLGRAKDVSEFVKHGSQEAFIEIELAANPRMSRKNPIIVCNIKRDGNKSFYSINRKPVNKKEAVSFARKFSIQIDNLCQFLPQDKVVEFAAMTPVELLRSTQRAVATQSMIDMHEELKEYRKKQKDVQMHQASDDDILKNLENRQQVQRADVERMREREELKTRLKFLEMTKPVPQYREAHQASKEAKKRKVELEKELGQLQREQEPALRAVNAKQEYKRRIEMVVKERKHLIGQGEKEIERINQKLRSLKEQIDDQGKQRDAERKAGQNATRDKEKATLGIEQTKHQMEQAPPEVDLASYNERIREKQRQVDDLQRRGKDLADSLPEREKRIRERKQRIERAKQELANLDSQTGKMTNRLLKTSRDTANAWNWIQRNQHEFEKPIFGPPMIECTVKDAEYADMIESIFQKNSFLAFTAQTRNDFKKLSAKLHGLHLNEINIRTMTNGLDAFRPPVDQQELIRLGAKGWALDLISGPEPVLAMLCAELRLEKIAVFNRDINDTEFERVKSSAVDSWVTTRSTYKVVRRREYGDAATQTQVKEVRKATVWTEQPVDLSAKHEIQEQIEGWQYEVEVWTKENGDAKDGVQRIRIEMRNIQAEQNELSQEKATHQKAISEIKALPARLAVQEDKLATAQEEIRQKKARLAAISAEENRISLERGSTALKLVDLIDSLAQSHYSLHEAEILLIEAASDVEILSLRNASVRELLITKRRDLKAAEDEYTRIYNQAKRIMEEVRTLSANMDPDFQNFLQELNQSNTSSVAEHEAEIEGAKASLELADESLSGGAQVIREYEQRQKRIEQLKEKLSDCNHALDELGEKIRELREKWEPELDELVGQISESFGYNMAQIGCAGEVSIFKDEEDFGAWAIQILVKFRDTEPLTLLDSHRQSGGERAVSTIFYLMSLQSLTRSPFRVVDEINQGMDPRNERLVHKRMVGIACGDDVTNSNSNTDTAHGHGNGGNENEEGNGGRGGSQYFLITPKLLPDLEYQRGMRVLCIASGEFMPEDRSLTDFRRCIDIKRGTVATAMAAG